MTAIFIGILATIHVVACFLLILIVLMQRPRSEGLGTAFGGGVTDSLFGSSAGNVLTKITTWLGTIFFITTVLLAYLYSRETASSNLREKLRNAAAAQTPAPAKNDAMPSPTTSESIPATSPAPSAPVSPVATPPATEPTPKPSPSKSESAAPSPKKPAKGESPPR